MHLTELSEGNLHAGLGHLAAAEGVEAEPATFGGEAAVGMAAHMLVHPLVFVQALEIDCLKLASWAEEA